ncbi:protein kinase [Candidatus Woesearchaeota archaeon]|nr:protein kinase [Candidatus Woesearchaeota archaeon]
MVEQNNRYFPELQPGQIFSHYSHGSPLRQYTIIGKLGKGEVKDTYVAEMISPEKGRRFALKVFKHPSELTAKTAIENLERLSGQMEKQYTEEIDRLGSADRGRYITTMADTGLFSVGDVQLLYIAEELIEGPNLKQFMGLMSEKKRLLRGKENKPARIALFTEFCDDAIRILTKASRGLYYLHDKVQAAHGDVKPENILVGLKGEKLHAAVTDFTSSRALTDEAYIQAGSMLYRAPEQFRGTPMATTQADVWALGVILWEYMTGVYPFTTSIPDWSGLDHSERAVQENELRSKIESMRVPLLSERNKTNVNSGSLLENLVDSMLAKNPDDRPNMYKVYLDLQKIRRSIQDKNYNPDIPGDFLKEVLRDWNGVYSIQFTL